MACIFWAPIAVQYLFAKVIALLRFILTSGMFTMNPAPGKFLNVSKYDGPTVKFPNAGRVVLDITGETDIFKLWSNVAWSPDVPPTRMIGFVPVRETTALMRFCVKVLGLPSLLVVYGTNDASSKAKAGNAGSTIGAFVGAAEGTERV